MPYIGLGSRFARSFMDQTGLNAGSLTTAFTTGVLGINVPNYELHHIIVNNVPAGASATLWINARQWGYTNPIVGSEWDPSQPMLLNPGDELYFCWNIQAVTPGPLQDETGSAILDEAGAIILDTGENVSAAIDPMVTCWFRYDPTVQGNS